MESMRSWTDAQFREAGFDDWRQVDQIRRGYKYGLSDEQVAVYAKPEYNTLQMLEVRWGYENGLSPEQVAVYARPENDWLKMMKIRTGFVAQAVNK